MRRYGYINRRVGNLEARVPKPEPDILADNAFFQKMFKLPIKQAHLIVQIVDGLIGVDPENPDFKRPEPNEYGYQSPNILVSKNNKWGLRPQPIFDMLESRNGKEDFKSRAYVIEGLREFGDCTKAEAEDLLRKLHLYLIRQVLNHNREWAYCEFELNPNGSIIDMGPESIRNDALHHLSYEQRVKRLKQLYAENCKRWEKVLETEPS